MLKTRTKHTAVSGSQGIGLLGVVIALAVIVSSGEAQPRRAQLELWHPFADGTPEAEALSDFADNVRTESRRRLRVSLSFEPMPPHAALEAVQSGDYDLAVVPIYSLGRYDAGFEVFGEPFVFQSPHAVNAFKVSHGADLLSTLEGSGLVGVAWLHGRMLQLAGTTPFFAPMDARGKSLAVSERLGAGRGFRQLGARTRVLPAAQVQGALADETVTSYEGTFSEIATFAPEVAVVTRTDHRYEGFVAVANAETWSELPIESRRILRTALERTALQLDDQILDVEHAAERALENARIRRLGVESRKEFREAISRERPPPAAQSRFYAKAIEAKGWTAATRGPGRALSWNAWFEEQGQDVATLRTGQRYSVSVDLSRYFYHGRRATPPDRRLKQFIQDKRLPRLMLQPILLGGLARAPADAALSAQILELKAERLDPGTSDEADAKAFAEGNLSTRQFAERVNLGAIATWDVVTEEAGCATLAISVWNDAGEMPLDHLVVRLPIATDDDQEAPDCGAGVTGPSIEAGLTTLLAQGTSETGLADGALHIFEFGGMSSAVFINRRELARARENPDLARPGVYAWELASTLSNYVSDPDQLPSRIERAHGDVRRNFEHPYKDVAGELAAKIFGGRNPRDEAAADKARASLKRLVSRIDDPVIVARMVSSDGSVILLPLSLLAARRLSPIVDKPFTVVQTLGRERTSSDACFDSWTFAIPAELDGAFGDSKNALEELPRTVRTPGINWLTDHEELLIYLDPQPPHATSDPGEGLILLAHHSTGGIWFRESDPYISRIPHEQVRRSFSNGSIALLAACTTSGATRESRALMERLSRRGVDALIISSFPVDVEFGTQMALSMREVVLKAHDEQRPLTAMELFRSTVQDAAAAFDDQSGYRDMALEFQLMGDPTLRFCE